LNRLLGYSAQCRPQNDGTTRCWICGLEHTRGGLHGKAPSGGGERVKMNLLPRCAFEFVGANIPGRIRMAAVNFQDGCANCYLIA